MKHGTTITACLILIWIAPAPAAAETGHRENEFTSARPANASPDPDPAIKLFADEARTHSRLTTAATHLALPDASTPIAAGEARRTAGQRLRLPATASRSPAKRFRARMIDWISRRDETTGILSDFLLPGSDMMVHLDVDPGDEEVVLEWNLQF